MIYSTCLRETAALFEPLGAVLKNISGQKGEGEAVACLLYVDNENRETCSGALEMLEGC